MVVVVVSTTGIAWQIVAVNTFADRVGGVRGMVASPRPYDYINYDYTPNGRHYAFWAFKMPLAVTGFLLLLSGVAGTLMLARSATAEAALALWACIIACGTIFFAVTAYHYLMATNFFI